ncbi:MAG: O-antigen ligase family protein [Exilispira sp.]|jgi:hypothetical protein|nr:O-antigen ligase family protein [Exilispira sp.]
MNIKKEILFFNFLVLLFFASSIVSISAFTFFQILIIFYAFFLFLSDQIKKNNYKHIEMEKLKENENVKNESETESNKKENNFIDRKNQKNNINSSSTKKINFFIIGYLLLIFGFIVSFIFTSSIKFSLYRLPNYAITLLIIPATYFLFKRYSKEFETIPPKYLYLNISIVFIVIFINFFLIFKSNSSFISILNKRQVGFLRNAIGFAYCMIFPIFYLIYNEYYLIKRSRKTNIFFLFMTFIAILIQLLLVLSSGSRTAIFSIIFAIAITTFFYFIKTKNSVFVYIILSLLIILIISFIFFISLPLSKSKSLSNLYQQINKYLINNKLHTLRRITMSLKILIKMFSLFKNPSEIPKYDTSENFRVAAIISSLKIVSKRPLNGSGPFAWNYYIKQEKSIYDIFPSGSLKHSHSHNDFLQILAEFGIFSFLGFILLLLTSIINIISKIKKAGNFNNFIILSIFLIFFIGGLTDFLFGHPLIGPYYGFFLGIFVNIRDYKNFDL